MAEQERLRGLVRPESAADLRLDGTVAGIDVAYDEDSALCAAAVVVLEADSLAVLDSAVAVRRNTFPYVPGLLAFREIPPVLAALDELRVRPDVLVCDGFGVAHPRRVGLASHLGVLTGIPACGAAKNPMRFTFRPPADERGASSALRDGDAGGDGAPGEVVGRALRTRTGVKPVFVSAGHLVGLDDACDLIMQLTPHYRLPETTRRADRLCRDALAGAL